MNSPNIKKTTCFNFPFEGFVLEKGMNGREFIAVHSWACVNKIPVQYSENPKENWLPVGSVRFFQQSFGIDITPDYYPDWSKPILKRKVWWTDNPPVKACFIKPNSYKMFNGYVKEYGAIAGGGTNLYGYWCSDVVEFRNEWRLYICNGEILDVGWYQGETDDKPCPDIDLELDGVYGALDIGETDLGIQIVEFHHPFSCGWYGNNKEAYVRFLTEGYLKIKEDFRV